MSCERNFTVDFTDIPYPGVPELYKTLDALDYVKIVFICLIMTGALVGNVCVIIVISLHKSMRTDYNIYVANLAVADLLVSAICMTSFLFKLLLHNHIYVLGPVMCKITHFCQMTSLICSVLTLSAIACDRFYAILFPIQNLTRKSRTNIIIIAVWGVSVAVSIPLLLIRKLWTLEFSNFVQHTCGDNWPQAYNEETGVCNIVLWVPQFYYTFLSVTLFFIPVSIMAVTYSLISRQMAQDSPGERIEENVVRQTRQKKRVIRMFVTMLIVFVICWMPLQIVLLYDKHRSEAGALPFWYEEVTRVSEFLAYSNSFLNPLIYAGFTKQFREELCRLSPCKKARRRFSSSKFMSRFRSTLTTALSTSGRKKSTTRRRKGSEDVCENKANPLTIPESVPRRGTEDNDTHQMNHVVKDSLL